MKQNIEQQRVNENFVFTATIKQIFGYVFGLVVLTAAVVGIFYTFKTDNNKSVNERIMMQIDISTLKEKMKAGEAERKTMGLQINTLEIQMNDLKSKAK